MSTDEKIQHQVHAEIRRIVILDSSHIFVSVHDSVVRLSGTVLEPLHRLIAEDIALRVIGVRAVDNELAVKCGGPRTDAELSQHIADTLRELLMDDCRGIQVEVHHSWVTLSGIVRLPQQRDIVGHAVRNLTGVRGITNCIGSNPILHGAARWAQGIPWQAFRRPR